MTAVHASAQKLDPQEQHYWIEGPRPGMRLFLRYLPPAQRNGGVKPILYIHGATFPSALSIAHRFDGYSWRDALCEAGFDVWAFDFHGYGYSDRYPAMKEPAQGNPPLCRTEDASEQVEAVVRFILDWHSVPSLSMISHSWGSMPAARFAGRHPTMVERLVLFGAIARRVPRRYEKPPTGPRGASLRSKINGRALSKTFRRMNRPCSRVRILTNGASATSTAT